MWDGGWGGAGFGGGGGRGKGVGGRGGGGLDARAVLYSDYTYGIDGACGGAGAADTGFVGSLFACGVGVVDSVVS